MEIWSEPRLISADTRLEPDTYLAPQGLTITASGITLDGQGAVLLGPGQTGQGIRLRGVRDVTIKNVRVWGYQHGIHAEACSNLVISGCQCTGSAEIPANSVFLDIFKPAASPYGSGILLHAVTQARLIGNDLQHQMNGLLTYNCRRLEVRGNLANYCSGFGFHLYDTCNSYFVDNYADYCCRYQPRDNNTGHLGADAAGFLIVYRSCRNVFRGNRARLGGDGFFLAGLTHQGEHAGCDDNLFEDNDGSYSPNIAFEGTFSRGNVYRRNRASASNYGFWLGFSAECRLEDNEIVSNRRAGIAVENGYGMQVRHNRLADNSYGLLLWSRYVPQFARAVPANDTSRDWLVEGNTFNHNGVAVRIAAEQDHGVRRLPPNMPAAPRPHNHTLRRNLITANRTGLELAQVDDPVLEDNAWQGNVEHDVLTQAA